jgi:hypothetical protein
MDQRRQQHVRGVDPVTGSIQIDGIGFRNRSQIEHESNVTSGLLRGESDDARFLQAEVPDRLGIYVADDPVMIEQPQQLEGKLPSGCVSSAAC